jgi:Ni/Fe-hydrogenase subunit HybB-like protein
MNEKRYRQQNDAIILDPIFTTGKWFYITITILGIIVLWGLYCYSIQWREGLGVTGLNQPITWAFYITNFVYFAGLSMAGTLLSGILRMTGAEWRRPITRIAEVVTVAVLGLAGLNIILDTGRPDKMINVFLYGRYQSPLLWDATSITVYMTASAIYLFIPLIPDIAILRDYASGWRKTLYQVLSFGWIGNENQHKVLERSIGIMAILVIPLAVSVHTVVSFVFSVTVQPMWHSTIFAPYFVVGAIFSGLAALLILMAIFRRVYHLEDYLQPIHFNYLGLLMLVMSLLWFYFTFSEYLTTFYGNEPDEMRIWWSKITGAYAGYFWTMVVLNFIIPLLILPFKKTRNIPGIVIASISICVGMWLERFLIILPTLANPRLHQYPTGQYTPSFVEWGLMAGCFALFALFLVLFCKIFPIISIWEIREGREKTMEIVKERIERYTPGLGRQPKSK